MVGIKRLIHAARSAPPVHHLFVPPVTDQLVISKETVDESGTAVNELSDPVDCAATDVVPTDQENVDDDKTKTTRTCESSSVLNTDQVDKDDLSEHLQRTDSSNSHPNEPTN